MGEDAEGCVQAFQEKEERRGDASEALQLFDGSKQKQLKKIDTASVIYFYFNEEKNLGVVLSYSFVASVNNCCLYVKLGKSACLSFYYYLKMHLFLHLLIVLDQNG